MKFPLFQTRSEAHIRKSLEYLSEAQLAWVEHQAAAEHHAALAKMYAERITRIESEIRSSHQYQAKGNRTLNDNITNETGEDRAKPESVVVYPTLANRQ